MDTNKNFKELMVLVLNADLSALRLVPNDLEEKKPSRGQVSMQGDILDFSADARITIQETMNLLIAVQHRLNNNSEGMCTISPDLNIVPFSFQTREETFDSNERYQQLRGRD